MNEIEDAAWLAVDIAKRLALLVEDRQERVAVIESIEAIEDKLMRQYS